MQELISSIQEQYDKKNIKKYCRRILKKCSFTSGGDICNVNDLAYWLYVYGYDDEAVKVCSLLEDIPFTGNHTFWDTVDAALCLKARILRLHGNIRESEKIIAYVNQYRNPALYINTVDWFLNKIDININVFLQHNMHSGAVAWRMQKLIVAVAQREGGKYPLPDGQLEDIIAEMIELLKAEK